MTNVLCSYWYFRDVDFDELFAEETPTSMLSDSGAFSAWRLGVDIDAAAYGRWVLANRRHITGGVVTLDVIGDADATWRNTQTLLDMGIDDVIPVWHMGSTFDALARYLELGFRHVGLGGMVGRPPTALHRWVGEAFRMAAGTDTLYHSFGRTTRSLVHDLPFYTLDSTTWKNGAKYGEMTLWDDSRGWFHRIYGRKRAEVVDATRLIRLHHENPADWYDSRQQMAQHAINKETARSLYWRNTRMNAHAWLRMEAWLRHRNGAIGGDGPKVYLSMNANDWQQYLVGQPPVIEQPSHQFQRRFVKATR